MSYQAQTTRQSVELQPRHDGKARRLDIVITTRYVAPTRPALANVYTHGAAVLSLTVDEALHLADEIRATVAGDGAYAPPALIIGSEVDH